MDYYSAIKKNEILPFATTWMDLRDIMFSEVSQTEKDKYCMISLIFGIKNKTKQNKKEPSSERQRQRQIGGCPRQRRDGGSG